MQCALAEFAKTADFSDAYAAGNPKPERSALEIWIDTVKKIPRWIDLAMDLRNSIVKRLGLKDLGRLSNAALLRNASDCKVGDRLGIFMIESIAPDEVVFFDCDKHLDVRLSFCNINGSEQIVLTTVVKIHNWLGRLYMIFVAPMHRKIVPVMLSRI